MEFSLEEEGGEGIGGGSVAEPKEGEGKVGTPGKA